MKISLILSYLTLLPTALSFTVGKDDLDFLNEALAKQPKTKAQKLAEDKKKAAELKQKKEAEARKRREEDKLKREADAAKVGYVGMICSLGT